MNKFPPRKFVKLVAAPSLAAIVLITSSRADDWIGAAGVSAPWNDPVNWSTAAVPNGSGVFLNNGGIATISSAVPNITTFDIGLGGSGGTVEILTGGSLTATGNGPDDFRIGTTAAAAPGVVTQSGGVFTHGGGETRIGHAGGEGIYNLSGGTANLSDMRVGLSGGHGTVNQTGGTLNANVGEFFVGQEGTGDYTISGATAALNIASRVEIGRGSGSVGTFNQNGGTVTLGNRLDLGEGDNTAVATYNVAGGTLDMVTSNSDSRILVGAFAPPGTAPGAGSIGVLTQTGGLIKVQQLVATENAGTTGTINLNGGVTEANQIHTGGGSAFLNFDGGTAKATGGGDFIFGSFTQINLKAGGGTIDSNDQVINILPAVNGVGKLTKIGGQALTLVAATNNYSGGTLVAAGGLVGTSFGTGNIEVADGAFITLTINTAVGDMALVILDGANSVMNLNFSGTETIGSLIVNGVGVTAGNYTISDLITAYGAHFASSTGDAILNITTTAVPEPSVLALVGLGALALAGARRRRERARISGR